tara:strand:+ start:11923 stop:12927 length:1005 start_codon:yes stop_codon:yes gene_type:complete
MKKKHIDLGLMGLTPKEVRSQLKKAGGRHEGMFNQYKQEECPQYEPGSDWYKEGLNNTCIVLGRDRPASLASGYGGSGGTQCGAIDLVAGRLSSELKPNVWLKREKSYGRILTGPNFAADAARVYITQRGDIDKYFALYKGATNVPSTANSSAVAMKADHARVIGRESVKIYAGKGLWNGGHPLWGELNSRGGPIEPKPVIELMCVGSPDELQPAVKGGELYLVLRQIFKLIQGLHGAVHAIYVLIMKMNSHDIGHVHATAGGGILGPGIALIDPSLFASSLEVMIKAICGQVNMIFAQFNTFIQEMGATGLGNRDDLHIPGWQDILSSNVFLN